MQANILPLHTPLTPGVGSKGLKKNSEYGHVAYQIKWNERYDNFQANILPLHTPLTPGWGQKVKTSSISEGGHVAYQRE